MQRTIQNALGTLLIALSGAGAFGQSVKPDIHVALKADTSVIKQETTCGAQLVADYQKALQWKGGDHSLALEALRDKIDAEELDVKSIMESDAQWAGVIKEHDIREGTAAERAAFTGALKDWEPVIYKLKALHEAYWKQLGY